MEKEFRRDGKKKKQLKHWVNGRSRAVNNEGNLVTVNKNSKTEIKSADVQTAHIFGQTDRFQS